MLQITTLEPWQDPRGGWVERIRVDNGKVAIEVLSLGGIINALWTEDNQGQRDNIVLGCDSVSDYLNQPAYLGAIAGRYSNRIANGQLQYQGNHYQLDINQATNCLHGGAEGFHLKHWHMQALEDGVRLTLDSPDGDMGFPGNCTVQLDYRLADNSLLIEMQASVDKACPISLTQHSYFNLEGADSLTNAAHLIQVDAKQYLPMNEVGIPTSIAATTGSDLDLAQATAFAVQTHRPALAATNGFDHCYVLNNAEQVCRFGCLSSPKTGRTMTIYTNQPGVQLYGANFLEGVKGFDGRIYQSHQAVCIEPQMLPDSPNQAVLPGKPWIEPGQVYRHVSRYEFGVI
ncbi:galactose mutarotase [Shewanella sp. 10N.286.52.C2]|uniref:aldose epimerase family protein n=1 Tax=Shewanella sp. 10N.286.52.C2 TaxID=1880838 RepID=UPI000C83F98E|nr:aldose epimerase family protein [Shewanella sp. 10N.286.52.C2]PMG31882.1 galactose mutarotase [Shewanella sp. 10N.286.52.C2]